MNNKKLWNPAAVVIALSVAFGTAHASALEQTGTPASAAPIGTYGVDVSTKAGLKSLMPPGWNLYIYKNTPLPSTISWNVQDTWLTALDRFAGTSSLAVRVDWASKSLFISTPDIAREDREKRAQLDAAAKTPLPSFAASDAKDSKTVKAPDTAPLAKSGTDGADKRPVTPVVEPVSASIHVSPDILARALARTAAADAAAKATLAATPAAMPQRPIEPITPAKPAPALAPSEAPRATAVVAAAPEGTPGRMASLTMPARAAAPVEPAPHLVPTPAASSATTPSALVRPAQPTPIPVVAAVTPPAQPPMHAQAVLAGTHVSPMPAPAPVLTLDQAAQKPAAEAFTHGNLEDIVRADAQKHGYQVSWETITLKLDGPVTFLGVDPAEDMKLLQRALGNKQSPISVEVYRGSNLIRVTANNGARQPLSVYDSTYSGVIAYGTGGQPQVASVVRPMPRVAAPQPAPVAQSPAVAQVSRPHPTAIAPVVPPTPAAPPMLHLHVAKGESLSKALGAFLAAQKWEMRWQAHGDMEADFPVDVSGSDIKQVLKGLLPKLGLDTQLYAPSHVVVIRPIDNTAE